MHEPTRSRPDPALSARIVGQTPLYYRDGADPATGRPPYVRAGSSLARVGERYAVVQDDANWVALVDYGSHHASPVPLPPDPGGNRLFDQDHGNKGDKLDLEACTAVPIDGTPALVAFGSGSKPSRERIVVTRWTGDQPQVTVHDGSALYQVLRDAHRFSGSELNVEGAVYLDDGRMRLFQRGNGAPAGGQTPVDATCDLAWPALWAYLQDPAAAPPPSPENVVCYDLGELDGVRLTFSDAELVEGRVVYSASAEASENTGGDGRIAGSVLGVIDAAGARWTELTQADGSAFRGKIEGLSVVPGEPSRAHFVVDDDAPDRPSDIFEVELRGPWLRETE